MKRGSKNRGVEQLDDHDMPTDPMIVPTAPLQPTTPAWQGNGYGQYVPQQAVQGKPTASVPYNPYGPYVPQRPQGIYPPYQRPDIQQKKKRSNPLPALVGFLFVLVQLGLITRIIFKLLNQPVGDWVGILYTCSDALILPVQALVSLAPLPFTIHSEVYALLAILFYGIISRIIVHLLKALLHSR